MHTIQHTPEGHEPARPRIISPNTEQRVGKIYTILKFSICGAIGGLAVQGTIEKFIGAFPNPNTDWIAMGIGSLSLLVAALLFRVE